MFLSKYDMKTDLFFDLENPFWTGNCHWIQICSCAVEVLHVKGQNIQIKIWNEITIWLYTDHNIHSLINQTSTLVESEIRFFKLVFVLIWWLHFSRNVDRQSIGEPKYSNWATQLGENSNWYGVLKKEGEGCPTPHPPQPPSRHTPEGG